MANGCVPLNAAQVHEFAVDEDARRRIREEVSRALGRDATDEEVSLGLRRARQDLRPKRSTDVLREGELERAVVLSAEEVWDCSFVRRLTTATDYVALALLTLTIMARGRGFQVPNSRSESLREACGRADDMDAGPARYGLSQFEPLTLCRVVT